LFLAQSSLFVLNRDIVIVRRGQGLFRAEQLGACTVDSEKRRLRALGIQSYHMVEVELKLVAAFNHERERWWAT
jgi:hypothetical protein